MSHHIALLRWKAINLVFAFLGVASCTPLSTIPPAQNPPLPSKCGLSVNLVIDRSGSIGDAMPQVIGAARYFIDRLALNGGSIRVVSFADQATVHPPDGPPSSTLDALRWSSASDYQMPVLQPAGGTNLEAGLEIIRRGPAPVGDLTVMFTDGQPNLHYLARPDGHPGIVANLNGGEVALSEAVAEANRIKGLGSRIFAVGVGAEVSPSVLRSISGPVAADGEANARTADYTLVSDFDQLGGVFEELAASICPTSLVTRLILDLEDGRQAPLPGRVVSIDVNPEPIEWIEPADGRSPLITDSSGAATVAYTRTVLGNATARVETAVPAGLRYRSVACVDRNPQAGTTPTPTVQETDPMVFTLETGANRSFECTVVLTIETPGELSGSVIVWLRPQAGDLAAAEDSLTVRLVNLEDGTSIQREALLGSAAWFEGLAPGMYQVHLDSMPAGWRLPNRPEDGSLALVCQTTAVIPPLSPFVVEVLENLVNICEVPIRRDPSA